MRRKSLWRKNDKYEVWSRHTFDFEPPTINCTVCDLNSGVANKLQYIATTWQKYRLQNRKMYYRESAMTMKENDNIRHCTALLWILTWNMKRKHMHWTGVCFANDKGGQMIYQSKVQMAHPIGSSTICLTEMLIIRNFWHKNTDAYYVDAHFELQKNPFPNQITKITFSGSWWDRTRRAGVLLLDVFDLEHPKRIQGSLLRGRSGKNILKHPKTSKYTPKQ